MRNQIKNIFNSRTSEISIHIIVCCMIVTNSSILHYGSWVPVAVTASIIGGIVLLYLLIWATMKFISRKEVREMPVKSRLVVETMSRLLFLYWIYITVGLIPATVWAIFILWDGIMSAKQLVRAVGK